MIGRGWGASTAGKERTMGAWPETGRVGCVSEHYGRYIRLLCSGCLAGARGVCLRSHNELSFFGVLRLLCVLGALLRLSFTAGCGDDRSSAGLQSGEVRLD